MVFWHILGLFQPCQQELNKLDNGFDYDLDFDKPTYQGADFSKLDSELDITEPSSSDNDKAKATSQKTPPKVTLQLPIRHGQTVKNRSRSVSPATSTALKATLLRYISVRDSILTLSFYSQGQFQLYLEKSRYKHLKSVRKFRDKAIKNGQDSKSTP